MYDSCRLYFSVFISLTTHNTCTQYVRCTGELYSSTVCTYAEPKGICMQMKWEFKVSTISLLLTGIVHRQKHWSSEYCNQKNNILCFYKKLEFNVIGSFENKSIVLDDTCYFLPFETEDEAHKTCNLLNSTAAQEFFKSFIFWDAKRPITADILQKLDITKLLHSAARK